MGVSDWFMVGELADLGPAAETVCDDDRFRFRTADRRQQLVFGACHRHVVMPFLEAEIPGQSATSGIEHLDVDAGLSQQVLLVLAGFNGARLRVSRNSHVHR